MAKIEINVYGYEGYKLYFVSSFIFTQGYQGEIFTYLHYFCGGKRGILLPKENIVNVNDKLEYTDTYYHSCGEYPELLDSAKKIYVHPCCKIPRDTVRRKYKTCLNPWLADAVIVPANNQCDLSPFSLIYASKTQKNLYVVLFDAWDCSRFLTPVKNTPIGTEFSKCISAQSILKSSNQDLLSAELLYKGPMLRLSKKSMYIYDLIIGNLPLSKIVFQETLMKSIGDETNKPTVDILVSVSEMLSSTDPTSVTLGMKTLATLDYMHYKRSILFILNKYNSWRLSSVTKTTTVSYMLKELGLKHDENHKYVRLEGIELCDYQLYEPLVKTLNKWTNAEYVKSCLFSSFLTVDDLFHVIPKLKTNDR